MGRRKRSGEGDGFWKEGFFAKSVSGEETEAKMRTFHMGHDEEMDHNCRKCSRKISAHNRDWHDGMCDECFDGEHFPED